MTTLTITARNYATDHANRIHSDETARRYGFGGALVPGVAVYSYMIEPVVSALGDAWLTRGSASVKFLKPVYDGAEVTVRAEFTNPSTMRLELYDPAGTLCAVGEASIPSTPASMLVDEYPVCDLPQTESRRSPLASAVPPGDLLGSLHGVLDLAKLGVDFGAAVRKPALLLALANDLVAGNVALGPWIHTASTVRHFGLLDDGEPFSLRGRVSDSGQKRGHDHVSVDLGLFGLAERPIAAIRHSALIRLREVAGPGEL